MQLRSARPVDDHQGSPPLNRGGPVAPTALAAADKERPHFAVWRAIVATHVPPFKEACWHEGQISNDDWLPHFTCKATGEAIREAAVRHPERRIEVLCGHTHGAGVAEILPNLVVRTGGAEYGEPAVQGVIATA